MKTQLISLGLALILSGLNPGAAATSEAIAPTDSEAFLVRAPAEWQAGAGWQDVSSPALAALGLRRLMPVDTPSIEATLAADPGLTILGPENTIAAQDQPVTPNDAAWPLQYGPTQIQATDAWELATGCAPVTLAVIDSGADFDHPDLVGRLWVNHDELGNGRESNGVDDDGNGYVDDWRGWDFSHADNEPADDYGHGTHVIGIANATANNGIGIAGVAGTTWGVKVMVLKVLDQSGFGLDSQAAEAVKYAVDNGARVINLSLGDPLPTPALQAALEYAVARDVLVVAASGNSGIDGVYYPARYPTALAVGAVTASNERAYFSTYGPELDLVAPGVAIYATVPGGGYAYRSGTSMAAPHVSGVAALLARMPQYSSARLVSDALLNTALVVSPDDNTDYFGYGLVQAHDALGWNPLGSIGACHVVNLPVIVQR